MPDVTLAPAPLLPSVQVGRLIDAWFAELIERGYTRDSAVTRRKHVRRAGADLDLLTCHPGQVSAWLGRHQWAPTTRRTVVAALRGFADWLTAHHHRSDSFLDAQHVPGTAEALLGEWATWLLAGGRGPGTVERRVYYVRRFGQAHPLLEATREDVACWLAGLAVRLEPETLKSARASLRGFYRWAYRHGHLPEDPTDLLDPVRVPSSPDVTRVAPDEVLGAALDRAQLPQERLMLLLAAHGGLRVAEIARVHSRDVHDDVLTVLGKGRKRRRVPLGPDLAARVRAADGWAFPSPARPGEPLTPGAVSRRLSRLLGPGWTAHTLRHRYASHAYKGTRDLLAVQRLLGHANVQTTRRYVYTDDDALTAAAAAGRGEPEPQPGHEPQPEPDHEAAARPPLRLIANEGGAA